MSAITGIPLCKNAFKESSLLLGHVLQEGEMTGEMCSLQWLREGAKYIILSALSGFP